jgi:hypothetical protein
MLHLNYPGRLAAFAILLISAGGCASWRTTSEKVYDPSEKLNQWREESLSYNLYPNRY